MKMAVRPGKWKIDRHVPYYSRRTLTNAGDSHTEHIMMDPEKGLGVVGRSGWIINEGPGDLTVEIYDGKYWSDPILIDAGTGMEIEHMDDIWIKEMKLTAVTAGTTYKLSISRGGTTPYEAMEGEK